MIVCVCRDIKDSDYTTPTALKQRIMQNDADCCTCQAYYNNLKTEVVSNKSKKEY
jgi:hypothetical protein